jgi:hypothetical protein
MHPQYGDVVPLHPKGFSIRAQMLPNDRCQSRSSEHQLPESDHRMDILGREINNCFIQQKAIFGLLGRGEYQAGICRSIVRLVCPHAFEITCVGY